MPLDFITGNNFSLRAPSCHSQPHNTNWVNTWILTQTTSTTLIFEAQGHTHVTVVPVGSHLPISLVLLCLCQHLLALVLCREATAKGHFEGDKEPTLCENQ